MDFNCRDNENVSGSIFSSQDIRQMEVPMITFNVTGTFSHSSACRPRSHHNSPGLAAENGSSIEHTILHSHYYKRMYNCLSRLLLRTENKRVFRCWRHTGCNPPYGSFARRDRRPVYGQRSSADPGEIEKDTG